MPTTHHTTVDTDDDQDYLPDSVASVASDGTLTVSGEFNETYPPGTWTSVTIERVVE